MRALLKIFILYLIFACLPHEALSQQEEMFKEKRERKRVWKRWRKDKGSYNPYLKKKARNRESARIARGNRKEMKRTRKEHKKELRRQQRKREKRQF